MKKRKSDGSDLSMCMKVGTDVLECIEGKKRKEGRIR